MKPPREVTLAEIVLVCLTVWMVALSLAMLRVEGLL